MLKLEGVETYYGRMKVLQGITLEVGQGDIVAILGSNGAGKSTILKAISGFILCDYGYIEFQGNRIENLDPHKIVRMGISQVPEGRQIFKPLSVEDNLELGAYLYHRVKAEKERTKKTADMIYELFPILKERRKQLAGTLSGGELQMLSIGRALMARPRLLLLDEPSMGLAPIVAQEIFQVIENLSRESETTILLVEQNARAALKMAHRGYVLETGRLILEGMAADLLENKEVQRAYLGKDKKEIWER